MIFNPPPGWPVPHGWTPPPDWEPDPDWPRAPPGWRFWVDSPHAAEAELTDTRVPSHTGETSAPHRSRRMPPAVVAALAVVPVLALVVMAVFVMNRSVMKVALAPHTGPTSSTNMETTFVPPAVTPDWPAPMAGRVDFASWAGFGGIDTRFGDESRSVVLDTHDTTQTWHTKWSGLIQPGSPMCALHFRGRVRDVSHAAGVPGGFGIGLATLARGNPEDTLIGTAIQFDFGQQGYRFAIYPDDSDHGLVPTPLDHGWHEIEVVIDNRSQTLLVDGRQVASTPGPGQCGHPVIRVWAGAAEFADFQFG